MLTVTEYSAEQVKDPFGILTGKRYQFVLDLEIPEEDELYSENGVYAKVIYLVEESRTGIIKYDLYERTTDKYLEFDMEADEEAALAAFCQEHLPV
ncbi:pullulanase [Paenibacillus sp. sptzw28]|uniref:DUF6509 family protein n=1 Tax=Paenibacillus sp. sptzw28 TaxID=715179 RepID=UPI001C6DFD31|nr:DUF6509 family protein [Paenibacillus sp. sptzw28]QYR20892.1 pullulanase [Paenibacillus sp. sptzw28]